MPNDTKQTGDRGEAIALRYLRQKGYTIVATGWRNRFGEIDIIARQDDVLVFVEVKTTRRTSTEAALEQMTMRKRKRLLRTIHDYVAATYLHQEPVWRVDVIAIALQRYAAPVIDHLQDALDW